MGFGSREGDLGVQKHLTNYGQSYGNTLSKEVDKFAPVVPTEGLKIEWGQWTKKSGYKRPGMTLNKPGTLPKEFRTDYTKITDKILGYKGRIKVPRQDQKEYAGAKTLIEVKTEQMTRAAYDDRRITVAAAIAPANITNSNNASVKWDVAATTTPLSVDIPLAKRTVRLNSGKVPNMLILTWESAEYLANSAEFLARYSGWKDTVQSSSLPPRINDLEVVILSDISDTAQVGQTATLTNIWGDTAWVMYVEPTPDPFSLTALSTFRPQYAMDVQIEAYYERAIDSDWVEYDFLEKVVIVSQDCICSINDTIT